MKIVHLLSIVVLAVVISSCESQTSPKKSSKKPPLKMTDKQAVQQVISGINSAVRKADGEKACSFIVPKYRNGHDYKAAAGYIGITEKGKANSWCAVFVNRVKDLPGGLVISTSSTNISIKKDHATVTGTMISGERSLLFTYSLVKRGDLWRIYLIKMKNQA